MSCDVSILRDSFIVNPRKPLQLLSFLTSTLKVLWTCLDKTAVRLSYGKRRSHWLICAVFAGTIATIAFA